MPADIEPFRAISIARLAYASGLGVEASRAHSNVEFATQFESAMRGSGPRLIEVVW